MPAAHQQRGEGRCQVRVLEGGREEVPLEVMHAMQGHAEPARQRLAVHHAHQQRAHQPGPGRDRDGVDLLEAHAGLGERLVHHRPEGGEVGTAGQFGYHAAEDPVHVLRQDHAARERGPRGPAPQDGGGGLVAGCLDGEQRARDGHRAAGRVSAAGAAAVVSPSSRRISARLTGETQSCAPITRFMMTPLLSSRKLSGTPVVW